MLAKFAEDDKIEQLNAQKRRMKQQEHKRAVEELLEARRQQFSADRQREEDLRRQEAEMEQFRKQIIEEERLRLLQKHAPNLVGYLPKVRELLRASQHVPHKLSFNRRHT
jgi:nucleotidyltransferase/DNA polymerase involved in DNA repair